MLLSLPGGRLDAEGDCLTCGCAVDYHVTALVRTPNSVIVLAVVYWCRRCGSPCQDASSL
jgi:C4-type Zn-finger protein